MNKVSIGGFSIEVDNGTIKINTGTDKTSSNYTIIKDSVFKEDFNGNIEVKGNGIKIIIEGDMNGNIVGNCDVDIGGDINGNLVGNMNIKR